MCNSSEYKTGKNNMAQDFSGCLWRNDIHLEGTSRSRVISIFSLSEVVPSVGGIGGSGSCTENGELFDGELFSSALRNTPTKTRRDVECRHFGEKHHILCSISFERHPVSFDPCERVQVFQETTVLELTTRSFGAKIPMTCGYQHGSPIKAGRPMILVKESIISCFTWNVSRHFRINSFNP